MKKIDKVIVTGFPRGGTSLLMRVVRSLGYQLIGHKESKETPQSFNPDGFFDLFVEEFATIGERFGLGQAVKLFGPFDDFVDVDNAKIIICIRDIDKAAESALKMFQASKPIEGYTYPKDLVETKRMLKNLVEQSFRSTYENNLPVLVVRLEDMQQRPSEQLARIATFLGSDFNGHYDEIFESIR